LYYYQLHIQLSDKHRIFLTIVSYIGLQACWFASSLIAGRHIDEFLLFANAVMINKGMKIFELLDERQKLSLISATPYECGVTVLRYKLNNE
jgi:hypothetical protein